MIELYLSKVTENSETEQVGKIMIIFSNKLFRKENNERGKGKEKGLQSHMQALMFLLLLTPQTRQVS